MYGGVNAPIGGWLICNGASVARTTYSNLFTAIGTAYGSVDANSFNIPNFTGRTARGVGTAPFTLGASGGNDLVTLTSNQLPAHTHPITDVSHNHSYERTNTTNFGPSLVGQSGGTNNSFVNTNNVFTGITTTDANVTSNSPISIANPFTVANYIIKF